MNKDDSDFIILRSGYDVAINDVTNIINNSDIDEINKKIIINKILRKQRLSKFGSNIKFEGYLYKYYDKDNNIGYIIYDNIYEIKGVSIFIDEGNYTEIDEKEIIFVKNNFQIIYSEDFNSEDLMNLRYQDFLKKFNKIMN